MLRPSETVLVVFRFLPNFFPRSDGVASFFCAPLTQDERLWAAGEHHLRTGVHPDALLSLVLQPDVPSLFVRVWFYMFVWREMEGGRGAAGLVTLVHADGELVWSDQPRTTRKVCQGCGQGWSCPCRLCSIILERESCLALSIPILHDFASC